MNNRADLEFRIREVLRRHAVRMHYVASAGAVSKTRRAQYAIFSDGVQSSDPTTHADAQAERENRVIADLIALFPEDQTGMPAPQSSPAPGQDASGVELAALIEERLFGVAPDDQDLVLENCDWRQIINALRTTEPMDGDKAVMPDAAVGEEYTAIDAWQELVEYDDRTSPEDYPNMALITFEELKQFMSAAHWERTTPTPPEQPANAAVEEADLFQAIHDAMADERNGVACGDIIEKGCEAAGYTDPESAADAFKADAALRIMEVLRAGCSMPPAGWSCSRSSGHEGPCAATPTPVEAVMPDAAVGPWKPIATPPDDGERILLMWDDSDQLEPHVELGWIKRGVAFNTYGKPFSGLPTDWMHLPKRSTPTRVEEPEKGATGEHSAVLRQIAQHIRRTAFLSDNNLGRLARLERAALAATNAEQANAATSEEMVEAHSFINRVAEVSEDIGFQAGVSGIETAGSILSYLAANPDKLGKFMEVGFFLIDDPRDYHMQGRLTWCGIDGKRWSPEQARAAMEAKR